MKLYDINRNEKKKEANKRTEFQGIKKLLLDGDYRLAIVALEEFLDKYPMDSYGLRAYASIVRQQGNIESALDLLQQVEEDSSYSINERAICYIYMEEYKRALAELDRIFAPTDDIKRLKKFCRAKLDICSEYEKQSYLVQQTLHYNEQAALARIFEGYSQKREREYFSPLVNIEEVFHNIQRILPNAKATISANWMMNYIFQINGIGYTREDVLVNYLKVITLPNSFDIITMYPKFGDKKYAINYYEQVLSQEEVVEERPPVIVKRESQVEKFNRRYGKK